MKGAVMAVNRKRALVLAAGALVVAAVVACGGAAPPAAPATSKPAAPPTAAAKAGDATRGRQVFAQSCAACHGQDAKGMPGLGKDMTTSAFIKGQSDAQLLDFIKKGRPVSDPANTTKVDMPPKGGNPALTDAQLVDIIAFMRSVQQ
jgi:disulfide bond formation protein DsbB